MIRNSLLPAKAVDCQPTNVPLRNEVKGLRQATGIHSCTNVLLHTTKMIDPRVKSQARGQNNGSRALK